MKTRFFFQEKFTLYPLNHFQRVEKNALKKTPFSLTQSIFAKKWSKIKFSREIKKYDIFDSISTKKTTVVFVLRPIYRKNFEKNMFFQHIGKKIFVFFHGHFCSFTGIVFCFFHVHEFEFHGQNLMKIFTGTFLFSRALFNVFSGFFTGTCLFFTGKKNTVSSSVTIH